MSENKMPGLSQDSSKSNPGLNVPSHEEQSKPEIVDPGKNESQINISSVPKQGIEVVAMRRGFYNQHRKAKGDKFIVSKMESLGEWMECVDPVLEKKRVKFLNDKKNKAKLN